MVKVTVDENVSKFPALEAGLMVLGVVTGEGCIVVNASPPDFSASDSDFFVSGQGR